MDVLVFLNTFKTLIYTMVGPGSKENYARERIVLAISLFQKNALPVIAKQIRSLISQINVMYKALVRMCSTNGSLRRFGIAKARQLAGFISVLATQLAKWRRLIEFIASKAMYIKDAITKKAIKAEKTPTVATENLSSDPQDFVDAVEQVAEEQQEPTTTKYAAPQSNAMDALATYSALDAIQAKTSGTTSHTKRSKSDKIAARRRRR
jgi:hypothetical protein